MNIIFVSIFLTGFFSVSALAAVNDLSAGSTVGAPSPTQTPGCVFNDNTGLWDCPTQSPTQTPTQPTCDFWCQLANNLGNIFNPPSQSQTQTPSQPSPGCVFNDNTGLWDCPTQSPTQTPSQTSSPPPSPSSSPPPITTGCTVNDYGIYSCPNQQPTPAAPAQTPSPSPAVTTTAPTSNPIPSPSVSTPATPTPSPSVSATPSPSIPTNPPFAGGVYAGQSADGKTVIWFDPSTGKNRNFVNGVEVTSPSQTPSPSPSASQTPAWTLCRQEIQSSPKIIDWTCQTETTACSGDVHKGIGDWGNIQTHQDCMALLSWQTFDSFNKNLISADKVEWTQTSTPSPSPSIPTNPPFAGGVYAGQSADGKTVIWFDPSTGKNRNFVNGVEVTPSPTGAAPATPTQSPSVSATVSPSPSPQSPLWNPPTQISCVSGAATCPTGLIAAKVQSTGKFACILPSNPNIDTAVLPTCTNPQWTLCRQVVQSSPKIIDWTCQQYTDACSGEKHNDWGNINTHQDCMALLSWQTFDSFNKNLISADKVEWTQTSVAQTPSPSATQSPPQSPQSTGWELCRQVVQSSPKIIDWTCQTETTACSGDVHKGIGDWGNIQTQQDCWNLLTSTSFPNQFTKGAINANKLRWTEITSTPSPSQASGLNATSCNYASLNQNTGEFTCSAATNVNSQISSVDGQLVTISSVAPKSLLLYYNTPPRPLNLVGSAQVDSSTGTACLGIKQDRNNDGIFETDVGRQCFTAGQSYVYYGISVGSTYPLMLYAISGVFYVDAILPG